MRRSQEGAERGAEGPACAKVLGPDSSWCLKYREDDGLGEHGQEPGLREGLASAPHPHPTALSPSPHPPPPTWQAPCPLLISQALPEDPTPFHLPPPLAGAEEDEKHSFLTKDPEPARKPGASPPLWGLHAHPARAVGVKWPSRVHREDDLTRSVPRAPLDTHATSTGVGWSNNYEKGYT